MARGKRNTTGGFQAALATGERMTSLDEVVSNKAEKRSQERTTILLDQIMEREEDTRDIKDDHVAALVESIGVLGLLEPLVVDTRARLIAGKHRLYALRVLRDKNNAQFSELFPGEEVPVRMLLFNAAEEPERALHCEVAENEHRRDYTPKEVKALADRLVAAGYSYGKGRPAKGKKPLLPAMETIIGKSARTIRRYLDDQLEENRTNADFSEQVKKMELVGRHLRALDVLLDGVENNSKRAVLKKKVPSLLKLLDQAIHETIAAVD